MDEKRSFLEVLEHFDTGMLCTRNPDGTLHARPMALAEVQDNGDLWFVTSVGTGKVEEVLKDSNVLVTCQGKTRYLSVSGVAELVGDEQMIDRLWREPWRAWFPEGKDDPRLVILHVRATAAEYWDESGTRGMRYAYEAAKAMFRGKRLHPGDGELHGRVAL